MKNLKKLILVLFAIFLLTSCNKDQKAEIKSENSQEIAEEKAEEKIEEFIDFTDDSGRTVKIPSKITKIAPSGPLAQQVILGVAPEKIVAIAKAPKDDASREILSAFVDLPEVGQFYGKGEFSPESLAAADPEIVVDIGDIKKTVSEDMDGITQKTGIPAIFVEMNFQNAADAYRKLGKIFGEEEKAEKLSNYVERVNHEIADGMKNINEKIRFVYLTGDNGLGSNPKGSFHMQMLDTLGENIFVSEEKSAKGGENEISQEELIAADPDVIIFGPGSIYEDVTENPAFKDLRAIKEKRYVEAPSVPYNWVGFPPSVNRFLGAQWIAKLFYPEEFDYDLKERVKEYYKLFYNYELSDEKYEEITKNALFK